MSDGQVLMAIIATVVTGFIVYYIHRHRFDGFIPPDDK